MVSVPTNAGPSPVLSWPLPLPQLAPPPSPPPKGRGVITEIPLWLIINT